MRAWNSQHTGEVITLTFKGTSGPGTTIQTFIASALTGVLGAIVLVDWILNKYKNQK
jgi:hypothetical protein